MGAHTRTRAHIEKVYFLVSHVSDYLSVLCINASWQLENLPTLLFDKGSMHLSSAFSDSKLSKMIQRLHSTNTLVDGMSKVGFGDSSVSRKRELELKIAESCRTRMLFLAHVVCARLSIVPQSWCPLTPLPFAYQESKARLDRLRRRGSNQAGFEKPGELPVPGILTARYILLSACLL